jgi:tetratricopeptide (TPR) repeat protein
MGACRLNTTTRTLRTAAVLACAAALAGGLAMGGCKNRQRRGEPVALPQQNLGEAVRLAEQAERAMKRGKSDEAITLYRQAITASPEIASAWHNMGLLLMQKKNYIDAVEAFKVAADQAPTDPRPYYMIGLAYHEQGWDERALTYFTRSLERSPNYLPALRGSIRAGKRMDLADRASLERARRAISVDPDETWRKIEQREALRIEGVLKQEASRIDLQGPVGVSGAGSPPPPVPPQP